MATNSSVNGYANGHTNGHSITPPKLTTPFLIIGSGPAGSSLAVFLSSHSLTGLIISSASGTAREPRAHILNPAAQECLRDVGLLPEALRAASPPESLQHARWCRSMAGEEYARLYSWGHDPHRKAEYAAASPCEHVDLPQTLLEPLLVRKAVDSGWKVRWDSEFLGYREVEEEEGGGIVSRIRDNFTGETYEIGSKYLFGCDGARSQVIRQMRIPMLREPGQGLCFNVIAEADLSKHMPNRTGNLHWIFTPELEHPAWGWVGVARMVKPWYEWIFILVPEPGYEETGERPSHDEYAARIKDLIGDDSISLKIIEASKWSINEIVAERYSNGNIFCLGDAVHRHPPLNGLGSNTCIQDAWNLAWKLAFVEKGIAGRNILSSYSAERQPIGAGIVRQANQAFREQGKLFEALGMLTKDVEERKKQHGELAAATEAGRGRRERLSKAIAGAELEYGGIGIEMNQRYASTAVDLRDEIGSAPDLPKNHVLNHTISTYPGFRLPHAWLNKRSPDEKPISTIDLAGHGAFCLLTGIGGGKWREAAEEVSKVYGVPINTYSIGWMQDWEDVYGEWQKLREINEDGCILVRPDRTVCWRSLTVRNDCLQALSTTLRAILSRK